MKNARLIPTLLVLLSVMVMGCEQKELTPEDQLMQVADSFGIAYFNWRYAKASQWVTPEGRRWMEFAASNVTQDDVDLLQGMEAPTRVSISAVTYPTDSTAVVSYEISNYLNPKVIGEACELKESCVAAVDMVRRSQGWLINIAQRLPSVSEE